MSDQSLRAGIEELAADLRSQPHDPDSTAVTVMRHVGAQLAGLLAAHPAAPAPVVTDDAVIRAHDVLQERWGPVSAVPILHSDIRTMLEAVAPLFGPRPLLDEAEVSSCIGEAAVQFARSSGSADACHDAVKPAVDAVMEMARPMPTREQIAEAMREACSVDSGRVVTWEDAADAVLALVNGAES
jgi:hypothetical protein